MEAASLVQPGRQFTVLEAVEELAGVLEVPDRPEMTTGYADIYQGFWTSPQGERVQVAIKELRTLIPKNRQTEQEVLKRKADARLKREVFVWSQTTHPNLHPFLGYRSVPQPRLISPWCRNGNLKDYLKANPGLSRSDKLRLIFQTACGLEHLHSRTPPICHADIKPENVLINDWYGPVLSDFGMSRVLQDLGVPSGLTTSGSVKGTWRYMSREIFAGKRPSLESDVYAFGGLILTVMSGKAPFYGLLHQVILRRVMQDQPPIPKHHSRLPANDPLWPLMRRCWNKAPTARPTIREVLLELFGQIFQEESNPSLATGLPSIAEDAGSEGSDMDIDDPDLSQQESLPPPAPDPVPAVHLLRSMSQTGETQNSIPLHVLQAAGSMLRALEVHSKVIPVIGKYIGAAVEIGLKLVELVQITGNDNAAANSIELHTWKLASLLKDLEETSSQRQGHKISGFVTEIQSELQCVQGEMKEYHSSGLLQNSSTHDQAIQNMIQKTVRTLLEELQLLVNLDTTRVLSEFENAGLHDQHRRLMNCLGDGKYGARGNAIEDVICFPGTRVEILERIDNWIRDSFTPDRVLWIRGMAGRGKSTIASTVVHSWKYRASCAIFHFRRGDNALNARVACALARQLGSSLVPEVRNAVLESVQENEDIGDQRLDVQFETLVVAPLAKLKHHLHPILIVIDGLDECDNPKDAVDFVQLITRHYSSFPTNVKFLLTCRPAPSLLRILEPRKWHVEDLDLSQDVGDDLARFIKGACAQIRDGHGLLEDWPSSSDVASLVEMSQGLFQWAHTAITYIGGGSPVDRLRDLLKRPSTWGGLDDLYHQILSKAFENTKLDLARQEMLYRVLGTLVVAPQPVSLQVIAALYGDSEIFKGAHREDVIQCLRKDILVELNSLLLIPTSSTEALSLIHISIRDLLVNEQRCGGEVYFIDTTHHHQFLATRCLDIMVECLKENICSVWDRPKANSEIQDVIERDVSTSLRYSCRAWSIHLTEGVQYSMSDMDISNAQLASFDVFSRQKLMYWFEVMSLIGAMAEAIVTSRRVYRWLLQCGGEMSGLDPLTTLWNDAQRFITAFSEPISIGSFHIYTSALPHCPRETALWECYGNLAKLRTVRGLQPLTWGSNVWTRSAGAPVTAVAFSPGGTILASGSGDGTVRMWDTQTGMPLGEALTNHRDGVCDVVFSPDGAVLASGSTDKTVRFWDARTGTPLGEPLTLHNDWVRSVAFSPDGAVLVSGSDDGTIQLWSVHARTPVGDPLKGHSGYVCSVAFSPDGRILASGSSDSTVRLWDAQTGKSLAEPLIGHEDWVRSVVFSPYDGILASGSDDRTIRLWDSHTGMPLGEMITNHSSYICTIAFSPDGRILASGSNDCTIRLWDAQNGMPLGEPLTGHGDSVRCLSFSPDGTVLASGSNDETAQFWDYQIATPSEEPPTRRSQWVTSAAFTHDGTILASGSNDCTIRLLDAQNGEPLCQPFKGHSDCIRSLAFSPNGAALASGSNDETVRFWDVRTGTPLGGPLTGHTDWIRSLAFSPNGCILASGSSDRTIRLWDCQTGTSLGQPLMGHTDSVRCVTFSPDGKMVASGSNDGSIRLWDAQTGIPLGQSFTGRSDYISTVVFSSDGAILAYKSDNGPTRLLDAHTGRLLREQLTRDDIGVFSVALSGHGLWKFPESSILFFDYYEHSLTFFFSQLLWLPPQYWFDSAPEILYSNQRLVVVSSGTLSIFELPYGFPF